MPNLDISIGKSRNCYFKYLPMTIIKSYIVSCLQFHDRLPLMEEQSGVQCQGLEGLKKKTRLQHEHDIES